MSPSQKKFNDESLSERLVQTVRKWLKATESTGSQAKNRERIQAYWNIGREIASQKQTSRGFLVALADQTDSSYTALRRCRIFHECWPHGLSAKACELSWSHQIALLKINDKKIRDYYIEQTLKQGWDRDSLAHAIKTNFYDKPDTEKQLPKIKPQFLDPLYVYTAWLIRVVDGDTLDVRIDVGFGLSFEIRLRLRGVNTSEMGPKSHRDAAALKARDFVLTKLQNCGCLIVKTHKLKTDIYGRYLADVYYHPALVKKEDVLKNGFYLNQQLLDEGLAQPMMG